jgi:hypothetical protein
VTADLEVSLPTATSEVQIDASRFAAISRLADDLAHEFKNPLHAMVINLEVLKRRVEKGATEAALERTGVLEHEVQRLNVLLEALFRLLRPERRSEGPASVGQVLEEVRPILELRARIARVEYNQDVAPAEVYTSVKPDLLRFSLIVIADVLLEAARVNGGDLLLTTAALDGCGSSPQKAPIGRFESWRRNRRALPRCTACLRPRRSFTPPADPWNWSVRRSLV